LEPQTKNNPKCVNLSTETWTSKTTAIPQKPTPPVKGLCNCKEEEISNIEFHKIIVQMINELEETQMLVSDLKASVNKQLNGLKENTNRWMKLTKCVGYERGNQLSYGNPEK
jgi:hypothetical protein